MRADRLRNLIVLALGLAALAGLGNVTTNLDGTTLQVLGDAADNSVMLQGNGAGVVEVRGINTTVNGGKATLTFTGVTSLVVDVADGDDIVKSHNLAGVGIEVQAGRGDETVNLNGTTGTEDGLGLIVYGDYSQIEPEPQIRNGEDTILVSNINVVSYINCAIVGDWSGDGKRDTITLANTTSEGGGFAAGFGLFIYGGYEPSGVRCPTPSG